MMRLPAWVLVAVHDAVKVLRGAANTHKHMTVYYFAMWQEV
jgi:hypothetical protein